MTTVRQAGLALPISLLLAFGAAPASAAVIERDGDRVSVLTDDRQPLAGVAVDIVSTDGTVKTQGRTDPDGSFCLLGQDNSAVAQGRTECVYLPNGEYQLFVTDQLPVRFAVRDGVVQIAAAKGKSSGARTGLIIGAGVVLAAGLAGGGGGGGGGDDDEPPAEPDGNVAVFIEPQVLTSEFEFGVSPCPSTIGELSVTNTGDVAARITVTPIEGISTTGQGQLVQPGDSATVTVLYNCLVIAAIAGVIQVGLVDNGQSATNDIDIVVDFL